ncbi:MAG: carbohydrate kinase family protein [Mogibacterium sp.]|nr:carbohydrate kinase family protein [Mogibacterium sp.]
MSKYDIVFIGTAILDSTIMGFDPEPVSSAGFRAESGSISAGGEGVNGSIASAKLGMRSALLCFLGDDQAGDLIKYELEKNNVDTGCIVRTGENPTPVTTIFVAEDGNRKSITNSAHRYNFHPEQYPDIFTDSKAIVIGSLFRAPFNDPDVVKAVVTEARSKGILIFADTKLPNFRKLTIDDLADSLAMVDYITPNEDEARYFTGEEEPEKMADAFLKRGVRNVIIKLGGKGCFFKNSEEAFYLPAFKADVIDATGAGDNFMAGLVSETIRGSGIREALTFASACGAICTTAVGAGTALKNRKQVLELVGAQKE